MGIFAKQGPYQEFKPLFVKEFDADKTIKTLNDKYADLDKLALINKTPALTYEQKEADKIQAAHQAGITKATEIGEIDPWKAISMTQSLAHGYVNDRERLNYERSLAKKQESDKLAGDNPNAVGAALEAEGLHSLKGGSKNEIFRGYTPSKAIDAIEKVSKIANMINADSTDEKIKLQQVGNTIRLTGHEHEYISQDKVQKTASYLLNDPEVVGDFRNKSYAELSPVAEKIVLQQNPNLSEMQLKAEVYKMLTTPKKETIKVKQVVNGKEVLKDKTIVTTELEKAINNKKNNMIAGLVDAVSYDKYKNSESFYNIPAGKGGGDDDESPTIPQAGVTQDPFSSYGTTEDPNAVALEEAQSNFVGFGENIATGITNALKILTEATGINQVKELLTGESYKPELGNYKSGIEAVNAKLEPITKEAEKLKLGIAVPKLKEDGSNGTEVINEAKRVNTAINSVKQHQAEIPVIPIHNSDFRTVMANIDPATVNIVFKDASGKETPMKLSDYAIKGSNMAFKDATTDEQKMKIVKDELTVNGLVSRNDSPYLLGSLGGKPMYISMPLLTTNNAAFAHLNKFTELKKGNKDEMELPIDSQLRVKSKLSKIVKHKTVLPDGRVQFLYDFGKEKQIVPLPAEDFVNTYLMPEFSKATKNTQINKLFFNYNQKKSDMIQQ